MFNKVIENFRKDYSLENIGHLYFWSNADKARFIADCTCLLFLLGGAVSTFQILFPIQGLYVPRENLPWVQAISFFSAGVFFAIRVFASLVKHNPSLAKLALIMNLTALSLCLPLLFSCLGLFDGFSWFLLFIYASIGFVALEPRYIFYTQVATLASMITLSYIDGYLPYDMRSYMMGEHAYIKNFSQTDLFFQWSLMLVSIFLGMMILGYLTSAWQRREEDLRVISAKDSLTGLMNRRSIMEYLQQELKFARENNRTLSIAMLDLDHFKKINDSYGHPFGDKVLKMLAQKAQQLSRKDDALGRYGGEEFLFVFSNCAAYEAMKSIDRLRTALSTQTLTADNGHEVQVRLSAGVAELLDAEDMEGLIERADNALYKAKERGRDQVVIAS